MVGTLDINNATVSMTSLLDFIHSMSLSARNKQWLADRLYAETREEAAQASTKAEWPRLTKEDMAIPEEVDNLFKVGTPLPADFNEKKAYGDYIADKYSSSTCC